MQYSVNPNFTDSTNEELNAYLNGFINQSNSVEKNDVVDLNFVNTILKLKKNFSKILYEVISEDSRLEILEYCLTLYTGKIYNIFTPFKKINLPISNRSLCLKYFSYHLLIYLSEKNNKPPLAILAELKNLYESKELDKFINLNINPLKNFSNINAIDHIKIRIDECLLEIKYKNNNISTFTTLFVLLILLDAAEVEKFL